MTGGVGVHPEPKNSAESNGSPSGVPPTAPEKPRVGDRVRFDGKRTSWLARAETPDGRYLLCTAALFGKVFYTIIDFERSKRGPMNVIGWGLGIETTSGPDPAVDEAIDKLRPWEFDTDGRGIDDGGPHGFELSHRGEVPLLISAVRGSVGVS